MSGSVIYKMLLPLLLIMLGIAVLLAPKLELERQLLEMPLVSSSVASSQAVALPSDK